MIRAFAGTSLLCVLAAVAAAQGLPETPTELPGAKIIAAEDLRRIVDRGGALIFDVRVKAQYVEGHVPGARNLVLPRDEEVTPSHIASFGADKRAAIVIYSHGIDGWRSYKGAKAAVDAGYSNIQWFRGGWAEWLKQKQPVER